MTRWLPFWIKEHNCSHWKKVPQKWEVTLHCQKRWSKVSVSSLQEVQRSLSLTAILYRKKFVGRRLWRNLNWKIIILLLFVHVLVSWNVFFSNGYDYALKFRRIIILSWPLLWGWNQTDQIYTKLQINFSCLLSRYYIWRSKLRDEIPNLLQFLHLLKKNLWNRNKWTQPSA